jgi:hypothetical protein
MTNQPKRIPRAFAVAVAGVLSGSHDRLNSLFLSAGAPLPIPLGSHAHKWVDWIVTAGRDPSVNNIEFIGLLIEEFMDIPPEPLDIMPSDPVGQLTQLTEYQTKRKRLEAVLAAEGLQYFRGGRLIPTGAPVDSLPPVMMQGPIDDLLVRLITGVPRAMYPLTTRRKGAQSLSFSNEYDVQDLLHVLLRPWVKDIRPEEYTPSYAGKSTRMDFLLPEHKTVVELKFVRDVTHGKHVGQELQIDIGHYRQHPHCDRLWCVVFDQSNCLPNRDGLIRDLQGVHRQDDKAVDVKVMVI